MSTEESKKHWIAMAPSILTGLAALIAALTTVYINVRGDKAAAVTSAQAAPAAPASNVAAVLAKPSAPHTAKIELQLERIRVDNDGSLGATDWTFEIQNGERSLFSVPFKGLIDSAGKNIVTPKDAALVRTSVITAAENRPEIIVRGWKQGWSGKASAPDVIGKAKLDADQGGMVIDVKSEKTDGAAFVLYFNTRVVEK